MRYGNDLLLYQEFGNAAPRDIPEGKTYVYLSLVDAGQTTYQIDNHTYTVRPGDILVLIHNKNTRIESRTADYHARVVLLSRSYLDFLHVPNSYRMFLSLRRNPVLHLDDESMGLMGNCFNLLHSTLRHENDSYRQHTIYYALKAYLFTMAFLSQPENMRTPGREEDICMHFLDMLEEHFCREHSVGFYADLLHLAPKYLSSCVKSVTGKPAIERIADRLLAEAERMLLQTNKSVSEVCYHLGFANPSAFGKFFRTHTGIGPREWRKQHIK